MWNLLEKTLLFVQSVVEWQVLVVYSGQQPVHSLHYCYRSLLTAADDTASFLDHFVQSAGFTEEQRE